MDGSVISALSASGGATIGGLTSIVGAWLSQQRQVMVQELVRDKLRRQELYREFIEDASKIFGDALQHEKTDFFCLGRDLHENQQNVRHLLSEGGRKRGSSRPSDYRYVFGPKCDLPRAAGYGGAGPARPSAKVDAIDEWCVTSGRLTGAGLLEQTRSGPKAIARALAGAE